MITRYISSKQVIARLQRMIDGSNWITSAWMYLGDGIREIGYSTQRTHEVDTTNKPSKIQVVNHKAEIPCDLEIISKVEYNNYRLPLNKDVSMDALSCDDYVWGKNQMGHWYSIKPPHIITSFEQGALNLFYRKYKLDKDGFLMIPDYPEYVWALTWFCLAILLLEGVKVKGEPITHAYALAQFERYEKKAKKRVKQLSRDQRQQLSNMWNSLNIESVTRQLMDTQ